MIYPKTLFFILQNTNCQAVYHSKLKQQLGFVRGVVIIPYFKIESFWGFFLTFEVT